MNSRGLLFGFLTQRCLRCSRTPRAEKRRPQNLHLRSLGDGAFISVHQGSTNRATRSAELDDPDIASSTALGTRELGTPRCPLSNVPVANTSRGVIRWSHLPWRWAGSIAMRRNAVLTVREWEVAVRGARADHAAARVVEERSLCAVFRRQSSHAPAGRRVGLAVGSDRFSRFASSLLYSG